MRTARATFWRQRWLAAIGLAALIAMWPACSADEPADDGALARLDFTLKDMNGRDVRLADFRGRPMVLNFWATWCAPCKAEIPVLSALSDQYRDRKLAVLGISVDDSPEDLREFAAAFKMTYPVLVGLGQDELQETYDAVMFIPVTWFVKADGAIFLKHQGPATKEWFEEQVRALVGDETEVE